MRCDDQHLIACQLKASRICFRGWQTEFIVTCADSGLIETLHKILVGGLEHVFSFSPIVGMMIQSDELIFFRGVGIPPINI